MRKIELQRSEKLRVIVLVDYHMEHGNIAGTCVHADLDIDHYVGEYREDWNPEDFEKLEEKAFTYLTIRAHNVNSESPVGFHKLSDLDK